jgi:hypothetical protein
MPMSNFLLFWMVFAVFCHTTLNFVLTTVATAAAKVTGSTTPVVEHSVEQFFANVLAWVVSAFKKL